MSGRISDERLDKITWQQPIGSDLALAMLELKQSRALVAELRALAERMRTTDGPIGDRSRNWLSELDSLLSGHGNQEIKPCGS